MNFRLWMPHASPRIQCLLLRVRQQGDAFRSRLLLDSLGHRRAAAHRQSGISVALLQSTRRLLCADGACRGGIGQWRNCRHRRILLLYVLLLLLQLFQNLINLCSVRSVRSAWTTSKSIVHRPSLRSCATCTHALCDRFVFCVHIIDEFPGRYSTEERHDLPEWRSLPSVSSRFEVHPTRAIASTYIAPFRGCLPQ